MSDEYGIREALRDYLDARETKRRKRQQALDIARACGSIIALMIALAIMAQVSGCAVMAKPVKMRETKVDLLPVALRIDERTPDRLQYALIRAAHYWSCALGVEAFADSGDVVYNIFAPGRLTHWGTHGGSWHLTMLRSRTDYTHRIIRIGEIIEHDSIEQLEQQYRHELGHVLGLADSDCPGLMCQTAIACPSEHPVCGDGYDDSPADATVSEIQTLRKLHGLPYPSYDTSICYGKTLLYPWPYDWIWKSIQPR